MLSRHSAQEIRFCLLLFAVVGDALWPLVGSSRAAVRSSASVPAGWSQEKEETERRVSDKCGCRLAEKACHWPPLFAVITTSN